METKSNNDEYLNNSGEVTAKEFIIGLSVWIKFIFSKWLYILLFGILGAGGGLLVSLLLKPDYEGTLNFVVENNSSNPLGVYAGIASQFGIDLGGSASNGVFDGDNIITFLQSRMLLEKTLLTPVSSVDSASLADLYVESYGLRDKWKNIMPQRKLSFPSNASRSTFTLQQDSLLNIIQDRILSKNLVVEKIDPKLSYISVKCVSRNETFSKVFTEGLVTQAIDFYINTKTQRSRVNIDRLQRQADSLEYLLNRKTFSTAQIQVINQNPARQIAGVGAELAMRDKVVLQTMYGEVVKNLELSKMAMEQETPIAQIIDTPILPLKKKFLGKVKGGLIGGIMLGIFSVMFFVFQRMYRNILRQE